MWDDSIDDCCKCKHLYSIQEKDMTQWRSSSRNNEIGALRKVQKILSHGQVCAGFELWIDMNFVTVEECAQKMCQFFLYLRTQMPIKNNISRADRWPNNWATGGAFVSPLELPESASNLQLSAATDSEAAVKAHCSRSRFPTRETSNFGPQDYVRHLDSEPANANCLCVF